MRELGEGLFTHPHGLRIDRDDSIWTTDDGSHIVLKLDRDGRVLLVLGRKGTAAEADWLFNQPTVPLAFLVMAGLLIGNTFLAMPRQALAGLSLLALGLPFYWYWSRQNKVASEGISGS